MFEMSRLRFFSVKLSRFLFVCFLLVEAGAENPSAPLENQELSRFSASSLSYDSIEAAIDKSLDMQGLVIFIKKR